MATYLPGITDYIPHIQPFRPDYNFYQKALETKEEQYKTGYNKISNLYGTLLNSEMTREPDIAKRDKFFKQVQNDIQRMSTVDLSRQENVNTAYTVFQPLIDDKNITQDMAWTKTYRNEKSKGEYLRNCIDPKKCGGDKWWEEGDEYLDHLRADYASTDDTGAFNVAMPRYVPYVNPSDKAQEIIKEFAPNVESVSYSKDGNWIFKQKNGAPITAKLYEHLTAILGQDSRISDVYDVKAANARYRYIESNAARFGGDKKAAEQEYVDEMSHKLFNETNETSKSITKSKNALNTQKNAINEHFMNNGASITGDKDKLERLNQANGELSLLDIFEAKNKSVNEAVSGDMSKLDAAVRAKRVDYAVSHGLLKSDMMKEAISWASMHSTSETSLSPIGLENIHHTHAMELENLRASNQQKLEYYKESLKGGAAMTNDPAYDHAIPVSDDKAVHNKVVDANTTVQALANRAVSEYTGNSAASTAAYLKIAYDQLAVIEADPNESNKSKKEYAKAVKNNLLAGLLDANGKLKEGFEKDPGFYQPSSPYYFRKILAKAVKSIEGDPNLLFDEKSNPDIRLRMSDKYQEILNNDFILQSTEEKIARNNKKVVNHIKDFKGKDVPYADMVSQLLRADGSAKSKDEFIADLTQPGGSMSTPTKGSPAKRMMADDAEDVWNSLSGEFAKTLNSNIVKGLETVNPYGYTKTDGAGGIIGSAIKWKVSGDMPTKQGYSYTMSAKPDLANAVSVQFGSDHSADMVKADDPKARTFANFLFNELGELRYKQRYAGGKIAVPELEFTFNGVSADNSNMMSYTASASPKYLENLANFQKIKGVWQPAPNSPVKDLWDVDNQTWKTNEVTFYVNKNDAQGAPAMSIKEPKSIYDEILDTRPIPLNVPKGGWINIEKRNGKYTGNGYVLVFEGGQYKKMTPSKDIESILGGTNIDVMINTINTKLKNANRINLKNEIQYDAANNIPYAELVKQYKQLYPEQNAGQ